MSRELGSIRREVRIARPVAKVWEIVGDPGRLAEWFPGVVACTVEGDNRVITTGSGIPIPEQIVTLDPLQHRFQYRITSALVREHRSTIDAIELGPDDTLVIYAVDAIPSTMALVIGGAAGNALAFLRTTLEGTA